MAVANNQNTDLRKLMYGIDALVTLDTKNKVPAVNLDNAATTPPFKTVVCEIEKQMRMYGSIGRGKGQKSAASTEVYMNGREVVKDFFGASRDDYTVFYTNCTTEGMNKLASALIESPSDVVLTSRMEHHANDLPWRERCQVVYAEVDALGRLNLQDVERLLKQYAVKIVSITAASNVTGYVNNIHAIAKLAHTYEAIVVVDGAQIAAHRAVKLIGNTAEEDIDFFVFSAHKMYSPFGGGGVVGKSQLLEGKVPAYYGGGMVAAVCDQDVLYLEAPDSFEAGSPNYPGVVGMMAAMKQLKKISFSFIEAHEQKLLRKTINGLNRIPGVTLYGDNDDIRDRVGIITFNLEGLDCSETAGWLADHYGIATRHAAFCAHPYVRRLTGEAEQSPCTPPSGMVRISFGVYTSDADIDKFLKAIKEMASCKKTKEIMKKTLFATATVSAPQTGVPYDRG